MPKKNHFYRCPICFSLVDLVHDGGHSLYCCETEMLPLEPQSEKLTDDYHTCVLTHSNGLLYVKVGNKPHPQSDEHRISAIYLVTKQETRRQDIKKGSPATAVFTDTDHGDVYAYCNVHGLFKTSF